MWSFLFDVYCRFPSASALGMLEKSTASEPGRAGAGPAAAVALSLVLHGCRETNTVASPSSKFGLREIK